MSDPFISSPPSGTNWVDNHWTLGTDGKPGKAGVDDDNDGTTDEVNDASEIDMGGPNDDNEDDNGNMIPNTYESASPSWIEPAANAAQNTTEHENASDDWGAPGKQHGTNNTYND